MLTHKLKTAYKTNGTILCTVYSCIEAVSNLCASTASCLNEKIKCKKNRYCFRRKSNVYLYSSRRQKIHLKQIKNPNSRVLNVMYSLSFKHNLDLVGSIRQTASNQQRHKYSLSTAHYESCFALRCFLSKRIFTHKLFYWNQQFLT